MEIMTKFRVDVTLMDTSNFLKVDEITSFYKYIDKAYTIIPTKESMDQDNCDALRVH